MAVAESQERREAPVEPAGEDVPWSVPPAPEPRPGAGAEEWAELSLRVGDDDAWLRALRTSLVAGGVRCHGGFADDGRYVSPRAKNRVPATQA